MKSYLENKTKCKKMWVMTRVVENFPSNHEALSSISVTSRGKSNEEDEITAEFEYI
jgi:hypothetical protein